jgi:ATP-dependent DNA helicase RecG
MAPTSILASQHYNTFLRFFPDFEKGIALLTSKESEVFYGGGLTGEVKKKQLLRSISENKVKIVIGTHALIQKEVKFSELAFVVVDEQHRFGVKQRATLLSSKGENIPHFLSVSATPIPRTLSLTLFGDLDLSLITELPQNRKKVTVKIVPPSQKKAVYDFIRNQIKSGRQAFVVCPRIESKSLEELKEKKLTKAQLQNLELKSVKDEYEKLSRKVFPEFRVGMLYGKMKEEEKEKIMSLFVKREIDILVSTSVIEVGIDVPNATVMMIEDAERFGLAQLYQFKGRVGRGPYESYCFLFTSSYSSRVKERLRAILEAKNGFELAEKDLKLRGPGEFLGDSQTGMPDIAMKALQNPELVKSTRELAIQLIKEDWQLKKYPLLKEKLKEFEKEIHWE